MATSRIVDHVGRVLGGRYRLLAPIGSGASAHVFLGDDLRLRRRVAVKVLHAALAHDESFLRRFRAEAQAAAALNHPNIVRVYDHGEAEDGPYLVLEHLGAGSLRDVLDHGHRLSPSQALMVGLEAGRGLDYAHRKGLVHRDIKPANLLFDDEGRLSIADFGLARALAEAAWTEPAGAVLGTARYASPEQVQGKSVDGKADVYALALVLVEAVTGEVPFAADTTIATLMARVGARLDPPASLGPLGPVVARAAAPEPADRIDAGELVRELDRAASELPPPEPLPSVGLDLDALGRQGPTRVGAGTRVAGDDVTEIGAGTLLAGQAGPAAGAATATTSAATADVAAPGPEEPARPRRWRRAIAWLAVPVVALLAAGGILLAADRARPSHPVPRLLGDTLADARQAADRVHLHVRQAAAVYSETVPEGEVVGQRPARGSLREGSTIALVLSRGPAPRPVPDLTGLNRSGATDALGAAGFAPEVIDKQDETAPKGQVLDWSPRGLQPKGAKVTVIVSAGPAPRTVPDLKGQSFDQASSALQALGLSAVRNDVFSDTIPPGQVDSTSPAAGATAAKGSKVTVNVSKGPDLVVVPDVTRQDVDTATAALTAAGLSVANVFGPPNRRVFLTDPPAGTRVRRGSPVNLYTR